MLRAVPDALWSQHTCRGLNTSSISQDALDCGPLSCAKLGDCTKEYVLHLQPCLATMPYAMNPGPTCVFFWYVCSTVLLLLIFGDPASLSSLPTAGTWRRTASSKQAIKSCRELPLLATCYMQGFAAGGVCFQDGLQNLPEVVGDQLSPSQILISFRVCRIEALPQRLNHQHLARSTAYVQHLC